MRNSTRSNKKLWRIVFFVLLAGAAIYLILRDISMPVLWQTLQATNWWYVFLGLLVVIVNTGMYAARWWAILHANLGPTQFGAVFGGIYVGQMVNYLLPARLGELARVLYLNARIKVSKSELLGTVVVEKVSDLIAFSCLLLMLVLVNPLGMGYLGQERLFWGLSVLSFGLIFGAAYWGELFLGWFERKFLKAPPAIFQRILGWARNAVLGLGSVRKVSYLLGIWCSSMVIVSLSVLTNYILFFAFNIRVPLVVAVLILVFVQIGIAPPSTPGKLGVFHYFAMLALSLYSVSKDIALAYALVLYLIVVIPKLVIGALMVAGNPEMSFSTLFNRNNEVGGID
jgi:uncharacterized protein (TIRG00374 family)